MDALEAIFTRRSTRKMKPDLPPKELIEKVIEAGRAAPSGANNQTTHLIVITRKDILAELASIVQEAFAAIEVGPMRMFLFVIQSMHLRKAAMCSTTERRS